MKKAFFIVALFASSFWAIGQNTIDTIDPVEGAPAESLEVTITGVGTNFFASESGLWAGIGQVSSTAFTLDNIQIVSATEFTATANIPGDAQAGLYSVHVSGTNPLVDGFEIYCPADPGCNDPAATNYEPLAGCNDGSCLYRLDGLVFYDDNWNGQLNTDEWGLAFHEVTLEPLGLTVISNDDGEFFFGDVPAGEYTITAADSELYPWNTTPNPLNISLAYGGYDDLMRFGLNTSFEDFAICIDYYPPGNGYPCNDLVNHNICYRNMGNVPIDGIVQVVMNDLMQGYEEVTPIDSVVGNSIYMSFTNLLPGQMFFYDVKLHTPGVEYIGEYITSTAYAFGYYQGEEVAFGQSELTMEMTCAYDPNDKQVFPNGYDEPHYIDPDTELEYLIRFQNTGNAPAMNVTVSDTIDDNLDLETFQLMANSHSVNVQINSVTRVIDFIFEDIMLPDSNCCEPESHGLISYFIRPLEGLPHDTELNNTAYIYFDNNPAIVTNTTWSTIFICSDDLATIDLDDETGCEGTEFVFGNTGDYVDDYLWEVDGMQVGTDSLGGFVFDEAGTYNLEHTASNPLCEAFQSTQIEVLVSPPANAGEDLEICVGDNAQLVATGGVDYDWDQLGNGPAQEVSPEESTEYIVTVTGNNGCTAMDSVLVNVNPLPEIDAGDDQDICLGESTNLNATGGMDYEWDGLGTGSIQQVTPDQTTTYSVSGSDDNGCVGSDEVTVFVNPLPTAEITENGAELTASAGESYQWYFNGNAIDGATDQVYVATEDGLYSVEVTNEFGCSDISDEVNVIADSIGDQDQIMVVAYPNPAQDVLYIQVEDGWHYDLKIFDSAGRLVAQRSNITDTLFEVDCKLLGAGTYTLSMTSGAHVLTKRIIIR